MDHSLFCTHISFQRLDQNKLLHTYKDDLNQWRARPPEKALLIGSTMVTMSLYLFTQLLPSTFSNPEYAIMLLATLHSSACMNFVFQLQLPYLTRIAISCLALVIFISSHLVTDDGTLLLIYPLAGFIIANIELGYRQWLLANLNDMKPIDAILRRFLIGKNGISWIALGATLQMLFYSNINGKKKNQSVRCHLQHCQKALQINV